MATKRSMEFPFNERNFFSCPVSSLPPRFKCSSILFSSKKIITSCVICLYVVVIVFFCCFAFNSPLHLSRRGDRQKWNKLLFYINLKSKRSEKKTKGEREKMVKRTKHTHIYKIASKWQNKRLPSFALFLLLFLYCFRVFIHLNGNIGCNIPCKNAEIT